MVAQTLVPTLQEAGADKVKTSILHISWARDTQNNVLTTVCSGNSLHQAHAHQDEILVFYNVLCCKAITLERLGLLNALQIFIITLTYFWVCVCTMACMHLGVREQFVGVGSSLSLDEF